MIDCEITEYFILVKVGIILTNKYLTQKKVENKLTKSLSK